MTTKVEFEFVLPTGEPLADASVEIQLTKATFTEEVDGIAMPRLVTATTDSDGKVIVELWPSTAMYYAQVTDTVSDAGIFYKFLVPEVPPGEVVRLQDLVVDGPISQTNYDEAALVIIHDAKVNAQISATNAAASAAAAAATVTGIGISEANAVAAASAAATSAATASTKASEALASKTAAETASSSAGTSATAAAGSATAAGTSATNAGTSATAAGTAKTAAETAATTATTKAGEANTSAGNAATSASAAATSATTATTKAGEAATSATTATTAKNDAVAAKVAAEDAAAHAVAVAGGDFLTSFNGRHGGITLLGSDVTTAVGFTPYDASNPSNYVAATGNIASATKLATARNINGVAFDGTGNITVADATKLPLTGGTLTGALEAPGLTVGGDDVWHEGNLVPFPPAPLEISANTTAVVNNIYHLDSTAGVFNLTMPLNPPENSWLWVVDAKAACGTNPVSVLRNGKTFGGVADNVLMDVSSDSIFWVFKSNTWVEQ